jgi:hypothetical protein
MRSLPLVLLLISVLLLWSFMCLYFIIIVTNTITIINIVIDDVTNFISQSSYHFEYNHYCSDHNITRLIIVISSSKYSERLQLPLVLKSLLLSIRQYYY